MGEDFGEWTIAWDDDLERMARAHGVVAVVRLVVPFDGYPVTIELGSEAGMLARRLHDMPGPTTLLGASPVMVEVASKVLASEGPGDWNAAVADLSERIPGGSYELALAQVFPHHVDGVPVLLRALHRAMTPGGVVVIADPDHDAAKRYHATAVDFHGHHGFCRDELYGWLKQAGYRDICFRDAGVVGGKVDGERQDFPMFLTVAKV